MVRVEELKDRREETERGKGKGYIGEKERRG